jgi:hypothetical protein
VKSLRSLVAVIPDSGLPAPRVYGAILLLIEELRCDFLLKYL